MTTRHPLRATRRPGFEDLPRPLRVVDAFAGTGGLTLGCAQAALDAGRGIDVRLAIDFEPSAVNSYVHNFPNGRAECAPIEEFFDSAIGRAPSRQELATRELVGRVDVLVGGPPCQGHSNLNNHTRRTDPKNRLYLRMARAAEILRPRVVLVENVPTVLHDSEGVVESTVVELGRNGYKVAHRVIPLTSFGLAQRRKRHLLIGIRKDLLRGRRTPEDFIEDGKKETRTLEWAIADLLDVDSHHPYDQASRPSAANQKRMKYLLERDEYDLPNRLRPLCHQGDHTYRAMYGRLKWDEPAPTITSGFGSMGRGRFMHPSRPRTLTPHEAARLQGFPDYFPLDFGATRSQLSTIIGNAVPPQLTHLVVSRLLRAKVL